ncbi:hypothetical protein AWZ03_006428 [Drosophila navojoa]|uniref:Uncharacterized protein n=1 Tax=Drosophila navojoa TaxID=7232 RepID=A0A484BEF5_DRONA|nr:hypothetical protein AWZ03_006428 [Drosophila navojoa]
MDELATTTTMALAEDENTRCLAKRSERQSNRARFAAAFGGNCWQVVCAFRVRNVQRLFMQMKRETVVGNRAVPSADADAGPAVGSGSGSGSSCSCGLPSGCHVGQQMRPSNNKELVLQHVNALIL